MTWDSLPCECGHPQARHETGSVCSSCPCEWYFPLQSLDAHVPDHDPTLEHGRCQTCNEALRRAFVRLADLPLGPRDADTLIESIRELART